MLSEMKDVRQDTQTTGYRRWFSDETMDLIVWYGSNGVAEGFQLCYDRPDHEHAFTWHAGTHGGSTMHAAVDPGDDKPTVNRTPILVADGVVPLARVLDEFKLRSGELEPEISRLVVEKLERFGAKRET